MIVVGSVLDDVAVLVSENMLVKNPVGTSRKQFQSIKYD